MNRGFQISLVLIFLSGLVSAEPLLRITPNPVKYGYVSTGGSHQREIVLKNIGNETVIISSCDFAAPFSVESVNGLTIMPGDSVMVTTGFNPDIENTYDSYYVFHYNNPNHPEYDLFYHANAVRSFERRDVIWSYQHIEDVVCVNASDDRDNDGFPDVVAEGYDNGVSGNPLVCLSGSGVDQTRQIWSVHPVGGPSNSGGWGDKCLNVIDDLSGDGHRDILRGTAWNGCTAFAIDGMTGETIWSYNTFAHPWSGWVYEVIPTGDLNNDGIPEVLAVAGSDANRCYCLDGATGELIWRYRGDDGMSSVVSPGDVNGDGLADAVCASLDDGIHVYCISAEPDDSGLAVIIWSYNINDNTYSLGTMTDINDDGCRDIVAGTWGRGVIALSGHSDNINGTRLWEYPMIDYVMKVVICPDLDDDGFEDILVASWSGQALAISGKVGAEIWHSDCGNNVWAIDYINDVNNDGIVEVVAGSFTDNVYLIDGATGDQLWQRYVGAIPLTVRGIGDVNGDGFDDVIAGTKKTDGIGGEVFLISGWGDEQTGIGTPSESLPDNILIAANYPNPFNSSTVIKFNLPKAEKYNLSVYDITGRLVKRFDGNGQAGDNIIRWDLSGDKAISTGIYFYKINTDTKSATGKMTYLK